MPTIAPDTIVNIAAYKFFPWDDFAVQRQPLRELCKSLELRGTILLSGEGINLFLAGSRASIDAFLDFLRQQPGLADLQVKESLTDYQPFNRMLVKLKHEIIPVGVDGIEPDASASPKITPEQLKEWLDQGRSIQLLDTRNDYEVELGTFENAIDLKIQNFRQFPEAAARLPQDVKQQPVVMFCTGGIRCEKIGPYMKGLGFQEIYQLEGGILKYFEECSQAHYRGDCFVFDQRVAVEPSLQPSECGECFACKHPLTATELLSELYVPNRSCPYCFQTQEQERESQRVRRQIQIQSIAGEQRGSTPYLNQRWICIPQRCAGLPLIDALCEYSPGFGREQWTIALERGEIAAPAGGQDRFQTKPVQPNQTVREGERFLHSIPDCVEPPINPDIRLIHEDEAIVVVDKSAPLPMHPSGRFNRNSLESILLSAYHPEKLRPAHRLDAGTTGLVVFVRKFKYAHFLQSQFTRGEVGKRYIATVVGHPEWQHMRCDLPIGSKVLPQGSRAIEESGQPAITDFYVRDRLENGTSILDVHPSTGRTHQIRLHLASLGFPIVNDPLYGTKEAVSDPDLETTTPEPIGLHAAWLSFVHPLSRQTFELQSTRL
jgi:RluA family pseudouridine synthase